ncbi:MAG TPA: hypothetical protein VGJ20_08470 [Xanthobacteraceae bacterium]
MFLNLRLMVAAIFVSVVVLSGAFGLFAAFYVSHTPLDRLPAGRAPLQLVTDNAGPLSGTLAPREPGRSIGIVPTVATAPKPAAMTAVEPEQPVVQQAFTASAPQPAAARSAGPPEAAIRAFAPAAKSATTPDMTSAATPASPAAVVAVAGAPPAEQAASPAVTAQGSFGAVSTPIPGPVEPQAAPAAIVPPSDQSSAAEPAAPQKEIAKPEHKAATYARVRHRRRRFVRARARVIARSAGQTFTMPQQNFQTSSNVGQQQPLRSRRLVPSPAVGVAAPRTLGAGGD